MNFKYYETNKYKLYTIKFSKKWSLRTHSGSYYFDRYDELSFFIEDKKWMIIPTIGYEFPNKVYIDEFLRSQNQTMKSKFKIFLEENNKNE